MTVELAWGTRRYVDVDGLLVHVEATGDGPGLALLHGFASGTFTWAGVAPRLRDRFRLVAWDRPPFGRSERPRLVGPDPYALDLQLQRSAAVLDDEAVEAPVLVGHSAGTLHACQAVAAGVVKPRALVLLAPSIDGAPPAFVRALARAPGAGLLGRAGLRLALPRADVALRAMGRNPTPLIRATASETAKTLGLPGTPEALWHLTSTWQRPDPVEPAVRDSGVPVLVIGGDDDRIVTTDQQAAVVEALAARWCRLPGVGHAPHEQRPEEVAEIIADFVAGLA